MPTISTTNECPIHDSFRVRQLAGLFDVPLAAKSREHFRVEVPSLDEPWQIGLIVGPSGSGKSTIARAAFGDSVVTHFDWPQDRAIVDCFADLPIKQITKLLTAVGFSSPPSWIKPYHVLSRGEQFRCDLARALAGDWRARGVNPGSSFPTENLSTCKPKLFDVRELAGEEPGRFDVGELANEEPGSLDVRESPGNERRPGVHTPGSPKLVVFDEFTSVVDRTVARISSAAVAKAIRNGVAPCRFVAVTCHYDIAQWLEADWIIDMSTQLCIRRRLRRPRIPLRIYRTTPEAWSLFARHHYLSGVLNRAASCYLAFWNDEPVTFVATLPTWGHKNHHRISRLVTLPDYQGIGIGMRVAEAVAKLHTDEGHRFSIVASHPSVIAHCRRSTKWRTTRVKKYGSNQSHGRAIVSFEFATSPHSVRHVAGTAGTLWVVPSAHNQNTSVASSADTTNYVTIV